MNPIQLFHYLIQNRRLQLFALVSGLLGAVLFVFGLDPTNFLWTKTLDPIIGLTTVLVALIIWWDEVSREHESRLPKKLTVRFVYQQKLIMICKEANLTGEADIRNWGQQLGLQMGKEYLKLEPFFEITSGRALIDSNGKNYKPFYLQCYLAQLPFELGSVQRQALLAGKYLCWTPIGEGQKREDWRIHPQVLPRLDENDDL